VLSTVRAGSPFAQALDSSLGQLAERDRRLAHEIAAGVLRTRASLDSTLKALVAAEWRRVEPDLKDVLRIGAYQLLKLERIPAHAAVETSVALARAEVRRRAAGLVNAVLRKVASGQAKLKDASAGKVNSHPDWLVKRWRTHFGEGRTRQLVEHNDRRPPLVIQPVHWPAARLAGALEERGIPFEALGGDMGFAVHAAGVRTLPGYREGAFVVQDSAQAKVLQFAAFPAGTLLWDACASPGGKSAVLSRNHRVIASDIRRERLKPLRETVDRASANIPLFMADAAAPPLRDSSMEAALLDAPCSATGTLARHPDARWRLSPRRIAALASLQKGLLDAVARIIRPGGLLVYATCSLEPEENQDQVNQFLQRHRDYERSVEDLFVFPGETGSDGAFASRLMRLRAA
jgi:16S rRNA (cytosine967-C5)-methyltransferase